MINNIHFKNSDYKKDFIVLNKYEINQYHKDYEMIFFESKA